MTQAFNQLVEHARRHSPFYREHYAQLQCSYSPATLPLIEESDYWRGNQHLDTWPVLTGSAEGALLFKTGGSTSHGKLSVFSRREWQQMYTLLGQQLSQQLASGDRLANLFYAGDLYASFLLVHEALAHAQVGVWEFPYSGAIDFATLDEGVEQHRINVLASVPVQLLRFAAHVLEQQRTLPGITTLLYAGESLFADQIRTLQRAFPNARIASIGYACVDAGLIGFSSQDCAMGEHRVFDGHVLVQIIDEHSDEVIEECDRRGRLVVTNLCRTLMPLLRYPVGDFACWREPPGRERKFALLGRSSQSQRVHIGLRSLFISQINETVVALAHTSQWQLLIERIGHRDCFVLNWVPEQLDSAANRVSAALFDALIRTDRELLQLIDDGQLQFEVRACKTSELLCHPRSGKLQRIVDRREYGARPT